MIVHQSYAQRFLKKVREGSLTYPLLLSGPQGIGKRSSVIQLAREIWCEADSTKQGCECSSCYQIRQNTFPDLTILTPEGGQNYGVDVIRKLIGTITDMPTYGSVRLVVIDSVEAMTNEASNAFLKCLEEPPSHIRFLLLTSNMSEVIPTIRSRCGLVPFDKLPFDFVRKLVLTLTQDESTVDTYVRMGAGSAGRSLRYAINNTLMVRDQVLTILENSSKKQILRCFSALEDTDASPELLFDLLEQLAGDLIKVAVGAGTLTHADQKDTLKALAQTKDLAFWYSWYHEIESIMRSNGAPKLQIKYLISQLAKSV